MSGSTELPDDQPTREYTATVTIVVDAVDEQDALRQAEQYPSESSLGWVIDDGRSLTPAQINREARILALGNPFDGLRLVGPFDNSEDALNYAETFHQGADYVVVPMTGVQCDQDGNWIEP